MIFVAGATKISFSNLETQLGLDDVIQSTLTVSIKLDLT